MGEWAYTCFKCKYSAKKEMSGEQGKVSGYCLKHKKYMVGSFPPSLEETRNCLEEGEKIEKGVIKKSN